MCIRDRNTRVQVEHPVSEMVTGIDIVKEQIWIAYSGDTALKQSDVNPRGHAIECRINAEDPSKNFQPSPGLIGMCHQPSGFRTRVDGSIYQGYRVTPYYDSMICKLICHGRNRTEAIQRTLRSLDEFVIEGITTTIDLHKKLLKNQKFINSDFNVIAADKEYNASKLALNGVKKEEEFGLRTLLDVLDREADVMDSEVRLLKSKSDQLLTKYKLLIDIGKYNF
mgnify:CR=1 FL=1